MFLVRTSRTSLKLADTSVSFPCKRKTTFLLCSPSWSTPGLEGWRLRERVWSWDICPLRAERSCFIMNVSSLISTGRSSKRVFRFATVIDVNITCFFFLSLDVRYQHTLRQLF